MDWGSPTRAAIEVDGQDAEYAPPIGPAVTVQVSLMHSYEGMENVHRVALALDDQTFEKGGHLTVDSIEYVIHEVRRDGYDGVFLGLHEQ